jgi:hypothetical protein
MGDTQPKTDNGQATPAGCVLVALSVAIIAVVAVPIVQWRDPETGLPMSKWVCVITPILAGAVFYTIGAGILRLFGVAVERKPNGDPVDHADHFDPLMTDDHEAG